MGSMSSLSLKYFPPPVVECKKVYCLSELNKYSSPKLRGGRAATPPATVFCWQSSLFPSINVTKNRVSRQVDVEYVPDDGDDSTANYAVQVDRMKECVDYIKTMLSTMDEGRISVSPYDTAWIALIQDLDGRDFPQFPSCLDWIAQHQFTDGSWGDPQYFCAYDRLLNTLACVVALRSWNVHAHKSDKGTEYIKENLYKIEDERAEHMTCGFEVVFPALLKKARDLGIEDIPYDAHVVREIHNARDRKLKKIPMDVVHIVRTSLLFSLEGLENLDWEKILKLQSKNGSFLTSPSSTAFAFLQTKDENCLKFINYILDKFNGAAPQCYPVDLFSRLWAVDRLERLGISRLFEPEISDCLSYAYRFWSDDTGIFSARESELCDLDDTSMSFRLLRLHGYDVSSRVFRNFKHENKFSCWGGQMIESPTPIYGLYRASQVRFPGEEILEEANDFTYKFLQDMLATNQVLDRFVISKHLPDEIRIGLEMPWYASLPRVVTRYYLQHYGAGDEVWIGKVFYRMHEISNDVYLELARLDFNICQQQHRIEWLSMQEWYANFKIEEFGTITRKDLILAYFLAAATIFEPQRSNERILWAKSQIVCKMITSFIRNESTPLDQKTALLTQLSNNIDGLPHKPKSVVKSSEHEHLGSTLIQTLHQLLNGMFNTHTNHQLKNAWGVWLMKVENGNVDEAELLVTTLNICSRHNNIAFTEDVLSHRDYISLSKLTNKICHRLRQIQNEKVTDIEGWKATKKSDMVKNMETEQDMQTLVKLVLEESGVERSIKQTFLSIAKTFYYSAYNDPDTIDDHIGKLLFEPIM
ncbi:hypothetical protein ABFS83_08G197600 [Erythranthe nasuta]